MSFYADLHIHSKYSRATSKLCDLEHLALWARKKGITVIATGDFTYPAWLAEMKEKLVPAEPGLFRLRDDLQREVDGELDAALVGPVRFMLEVEISTIYKRGDRCRKVHHLIYAPDFDRADRIVERLDAIGNIRSDGRPILGLDSRDLLEITLEAGGGSFLVPAHIWTPWFAVLGSKSGFDDIESCYGELSSEIFALETGLSSDPPMNWRLSCLDRFSLISNSDTHSPQKVGREANVFDTEIDFFAMRRALETGEGYQGTVEFYPEEGKYHLDGHRKCDTRLEPAETQANNGLCPVCGKPVTVGVMHRVHELADRETEERPSGAAPFRSFIPLVEILAEIRGVGAQSKKVQQLYEQLVTRLGPELQILEHTPREEITRLGSEVLGEAIQRMRTGNVIREGGYDGEYGVIRVFTPGELSRFAGTGRLFALPEGPPASTPKPTPAQPRKKAAKKPRSRAKRQSKPEPPAKPLDSLDPDQRSAASITHGHLLIIAGPGTGKTRTLTHRLAHLIADQGADPRQCLSITFTRRAAQEMHERLQGLIPEQAEGMPVMTFHGLGLQILREHAARVDLPLDFRAADEEEQLEVLRAALDTPARKTKQILREISRNKRAGLVPEPGSAAAEQVSAYNHALRSRGLVDFDDMIQLPVQLLAAHADLARAMQQRFVWISVDEYQDIDAAQYRLLRSLVGPKTSLCAIGDPDQAIYSFRGTDVRFFQRFQSDFPSAQLVQLTRNYRSNRTIVNAAVQAIAPTSLVQERVLNALNEDECRIVIQECATDRAEAEFVVHSIERLIGGSTFFSLDSDRVASHEGEALAFSDFGVLYRTDSQAATLCEAFDRSGMPFQKHGHSRLSDDPVVRDLLQALQTTAGPSLRERLTEAADALAIEPEMRTQVLDRLGPLVTRHGDDEAAFLTEIALGVDADLWDPRADRVSLLTLHAAKGLEFRAVFMVGCEDGILPLRWGTETNEEEERRLFFVGLTRACDHLFLSHARKRHWQGRVQTLPISPFLRDIEEELLERQAAQAGRKAARNDQMTLF